MNKYKDGRWGKIKTGRWAGKLLWFVPYQEYWRAELTDKTLTYQAWGLDFAPEELNNEPYEVVKLYFEL